MRRLSIVIISLLLTIGGVIATEPQAPQYVQLKKRVEQLSDYTKGDSIQRLVSDSIAELAAQSSDTTMAHWLLLHSYRLRMDYESGQKNFKEYIKYAEKAEAECLAMGEIKEYSELLKKETNRLYNNGCFKLAQQKADTLTAFAKRTGDKTALFYSMYAHGELVYAYDKPAAIALYQQAAQICQTHMNDSTLLNQCYSRIGKYYMETEQWDSLTYWGDKMLQVQPVYNYRAIYFKCEAMFKSHQWDEFNTLFNTYIAPQSNHGKTFDRFLSSILHIYKKVVDGDKEGALKLCDELRSYNNKIALRHTVYEISEDWKNAYHYQKLCNAHKDSVRNAMNSERIEEAYAEMDAIYRTSEQEKQILRHRFMNFVAIFLLVIVLMVAFIFYDRNRQMKFKNIALTHRINEMLDARASETSVETHIQPVQDNGTVSKEEMNVTLAQVQTFIEHLKEGQRFCQADFDRNELMDQMHLSRRAFSKDFETIIGLSIPKYLLKLRLEYAAEQIRQHPEYTLEAIALDCGIGSRATFYRNFTEHFGISPSDYRETISKG